VRLQRDGEELTLYFPNPRAMLPVRLKSGETRLIIWGRRREESGRLPQTGWARLDSIRAGKWDWLSPRPVKILVDAFMEKDKQGQSHWYSLEPGESIQGLVANWHDEQRLYVVTDLSSRADRASIHDRWPRIIGGETQACEKR
jgi:hypothetical protein